LALAGLIEPGDEIEQRSLTGAGRSHEREEFALRHRQGQVLKHVDLLAAAAEELVQSGHLDDRSVVHQSPQSEESQGAGRDRRRDVPGIVKIAKSQAAVMRTKTGESSSA